MYEYRCTKCNHVFEKIQRFSDPPIKKCPECGAPVEQVISAPAVQFKGAGWYVNDYAKKSGGNGSKSDVSSAAESKSSDSKSAESKSGESKSTESKSTTKLESKPDPSSKSSKK